MREIGPKRFLKQPEDQEWVNMANAERDERLAATWAFHIPEVSASAFAITAFYCSIGPQRRFGGLEFWPLHPPTRPSETQAMMATVGEANHVVYTTQNVHDAKLDKDLILKYKGLLKATRSVVKQINFL